MKAKETKKGNIKLIIGREEVELLAMISFFDASIPFVIFRNDTEIEVKATELLGNLHYKLVEVLSGEEE